MDHGKHAKFYHGLDGLCDLKGLPEVDMNLIQTEHASCAINRIVGGNQGHDWTLYNFDEKQESQSVATRTHGFFFIIYNLIDFDEYKKAQRHLFDAYGPVVIVTEC